MSITQRFPIFGLLGMRHYQYYWVSANMVFASRWMLIVVTGWLVLDLTDSAFMVALAGSLQWVPMLVLGTFIGVITDWFNRRLLLIASQIVQSLSCFLLGLLVVVGVVQTWQVMLVSLVIGLGWAFDLPTRRAIMPDLVGTENVPKSIAIDISIMTLMAAVGAIAGGELIEGIGMGNCFLVIGSLYAVAVLFLYLIGRVSQAPLIGEKNILGNAAEGLGYIFRHQAILAVMVITVVINVMVLPFNYLLPIFARDILQVGSVGLGYLTGISGISAFIGSMILANLGNIRRPGFFFLVGSFGFGALLLAFASSTIYQLSLGILFVDGFCRAIFATFQGTILLHLTSEEMRGRVMGILSLCIGTIPLGILAFGALANVIGTPFVVGISAGLASVMVLMVFFVMPSLRRIEWS